MGRGSQGGGAVDVNEGKVRRMKCKRKERKGSKVRGKKEKEVR